VLPLSRERRSQVFRVRADDMGLCPCPEPNRLLKKVTWMKNEE